jgi:hypothetical protein
MASIPSAELILLEVHQSLGLVAPSKKQELIGLARPLETHQEIVRDLVVNIFTALGMDDQAKHDASINLLGFFDFNNFIERSVWTFDASQQQIVWNMAAHSYAPSLGRTVAFWSLGQTLDEGMPGGSFWYLPEVVEKNGYKELHMPVAQVLDWLLDLLGQSMSDFVQVLGGKIDEADKSINVGIELDSIERVLGNWCKGVLPRVENIELYFSDTTKLVFSGAYLIDDAANPVQQFQSALKFIKNKKLTAEHLREQIPMTQTGRIENILSGQADDEENSIFTSLIALRYAEPSLQTIRKRLLIARAVQDGYFRLGKFLFGDNFDKISADIEKNKVLQLFEIYKFSYNLTVDAYKQSGDAIVQDAYFERQIPIWDRWGIFLSITPSKKIEAAPILANRLNHLFAMAERDENLADHIGYDTPSSSTIAERNIKTLGHEQEEKDNVTKCLKKLQTSSPWRTLQLVTSYWVAYELAQIPANSLKIRQFAVARMRELAQSPKEVMGAICIELSHLLNNDDRQYRCKDARAKVDALLLEAKANPKFEMWIAIILQYEAKHCLAFNDFENARRLFKEALDACKKTGFGSLRGEIARDGFALVIEQPPTKFDLKNYEYYFRNMLAYGGFEWTGIGRSPTFEDVACEMSSYFWETLYWPYSNEIIAQPLSKHQYEEFIQSTQPLIESGNFESLHHWFNKHPGLKNTKFKEVRGNTALMIWMKMLYELEKRKPLLDYSLKICGQGKADGLLNFMSNWRKAICLMIGVWPRLVNVQDFKLQTPLMLAANHGDIVVLQKLLDENSDVMSQDFKGRTALHAAVAANALQCVEVLLAHNAAIVGLLADEDQSALHTAVRVGNPEIVSVLIKHAPQLKQFRNTRNQTALALASELISPDIMKIHFEAMMKEGRKISTLTDFKNVINILSDE